MKSVAQIIIEKELEAFNDVIKDRLIEKKINNSLALSNSLRVETLSNGAASVGLEYIEFLDRGRMPGSVPPFQNIFDWVQSKLGIIEDKEAKSAAYAIMNKIATKGTNIFQDKSKGLELTEVIEKLQKELPEKVGAAYSTEIQNNLYDYWKRKGITF